MELHSKQKGNIASSSVVLALQEEGFNVFSEIGDYSRIDLIAEKNGVLKSIQVKYCGYKEGVIILKLQKAGPNGYRYTYSEKDVGWFALYDPVTKKVAWVSSKEACEHNNIFTIRVSPVKNGQSSGVKLIEDYGIDKFLRDFTQNTVTPIGDDKVQTTTE